MKKIINGRLYNTNTAEEVDSYREPRSYNDFRFFEETLYKKRTGEFFLAGNGGPLTKYGERVGDMTGYGENIFPLTEDEVKEWLEQYSTTEIYENYFDVTE